MVETPMKPGDLVLNRVFLDLHEIHPRFSEEYSPRDVLNGSMGVILEVNTDDPLWSETRVYKQPGTVWVKWCVNGMVGWSDPCYMEVIK